MTPIQDILGEGNGNPFQYSCLKISIDRSTWCAMVHGIADSDTTECAHAYTHTHTHTHNILI